MLDKTNGMWNLKEEKKKKKKKRRRLTAVFQSIYGLVC